MKKTVNTIAPPIAMLPIGRGMAVKKVDPGYQRSPFGYKKVQMIEKKEEFSTWSCTSVVN
jgi:hypothetical protein